MEKKTKWNKNMWKRVTLISIIVILIISGIGGTVYAYRVLNMETFYEGIKIDGISLENMNKKEALAKFRNDYQPTLDNMKIILSHGEETWEFDYNDIDAEIDIEEVVDKAYSIGREGNIIERLRDIYRIAKEPKAYKTNLTYDVSLIDKDIEAISKEIHVEPVDADLEFHPDRGDKFTFSSEKIGKGMLLEKTIEDVRAKVEAKDFSLYQIPTEELHPKYTLDEVKTWTSRIAYYSTRLTNNTNRNHNIRLSSAAFDNVRLNPGEEYSMNEATGPRGRAEGYRDASVIKQGKKFEDEPGGGNCQTSTTLYGAVMRADLQILNRYPHSIISTYTDIGTDAMVDYPWADLVFKNTKDTPVFITRYIYDNRLHVEVYGKSPEEYDEIRIVSEKVSESDIPEYTIVEDPNLLEGREIVDWRSRAEIRAVSYKVYYKDGKEIKREKESSSTYPGVVGQKTVGTMIKPVEEPVEEPETIPEENEAEEVDQAEETDEIQETEEEESGG